MLIFGVSGSPWQLPLATAGHNWLTRLQRGREPVPLVSFPYPVPKTAQRAAQGRVLVFSPERAYPSPFRGRGEVSPVWFAGFFTQRNPVLFRRKRRILRIRGLLYAVACGNCWSQTAHTPPTAPVWGCAGVVSLPGCQNRTRRHTGASLVFTVFSWYASFAEVPQAGTPGGNSPHREWEGSCKAASRFSQCRLMSTPLSARFR